MPKFSVHGAVSAGKYLGEYEAESPEEAAHIAYDEKGYVSLCHQCSPEAENAEIMYVTVTDEAGEEVWTDEQKPITVTRDEVALLVEAAEKGQFDDPERGEAFKNLLIRLRDASASGEEMSPDAH